MQPDGQRQTDQTTDSRARSSVGEKKGVFWGVGRGSETKGKEGRRRVGQPQEGLRDHGVEGHRRETDIEPPGEWKSWGSQNKTETREGESQPGKERQRNRDFTESSKTTTNC
jgi:hypothetical protein